MINTRNRLVRVFKSLSLSIPFQVFRPLEILALRFCPLRTHRPPVIFIISLPRSGSTLAYQCFSSRFALNYLSNFSHFFFRLPLFANLISSFLFYLFGKTSSFSSSNGFVPGLLGHAEGLLFWSYWMNAALEEQENADYSAYSKRSNLLLSVFYALRGFTGIPFLSAYLGHLLCLPRLSSCFPNAIFIRLRRCPILIALSLYYCLQQSHSDWFSLFPQGCVPYRTQSDVIKVSSQVYWLLKNLDALSNNENVFDCSYEQICYDPELVVECFRIFCCKRGIDLMDRFPLPARFSCRSLDDYPEALVTSIKQCLRYLVLRHGTVFSLELSDLA